MALNKKEIQNALENVQEAFPVVEKRMGVSSDMMNALYGIEASLALLLQQSNADKKKAAVYMDKAGFNRFESNFNLLQKEFKQIKIAAVYPYLREPILNVIISVTKIIGALRKTYI